MFNLRSLFSIIQPQINFKNPKLHMQIWKLYAIPLKLTFSVKVNDMVNGDEIFFKLNYVIVSFQMLYYLNENFFDSVSQLKVLVQYSDQIEH